MKNKKGDIWVSAVLYIALGMVVIIIVLAAGLPLISKMRDRNTLAQTKRMMTTIDDTIRDVATEGPGSRRVISPLEIGSGELRVNIGGNSIDWKMTTKNMMMEPGVTFEEGTLNLKFEETIVEGQYNLIIFTNYTGFAELTLAESSQKGPYTGRYNLVVYNTGDFASETGLPKISLSFI